MADTVMTTPKGGSSVPLTYETGPPAAGGLEALKYAAQADIFQDDPNFFTWLDDWIGKQDEETIMIDAFITLNDYSAQFEFQQQQQQQQQQEQGITVDNQAHASFDAIDNSTPGSVASYAPCPLRSGSYQQQPCQLTDRPQGGTCSSASLASHPSSNQSEDNSFNITASRTDSSLAIESAPSPSSPSCTPAATFGPGKRPFPDAPSGPHSRPAIGTSSPFDTATFTLPLHRDLEPPGFLADLTNFLRNDAVAPSAPPGPFPPSAGRIPSYGTVSSFVGPPPLPPHALSPPHPAMSAPRLPFNPAPAATAAWAPQPAPTRPSSPLTITSIEQLIAKAICGNTGGGSGTLASLGILRGLPATAGGRGSSADDFSSGSSRSGCDHAMETGGMGRGGREDGTDWPMCPGATSGAADTSGGALQQRLPRKSTLPWSAFVHHNHQHHQQPLHPQQQQRLSGSSIPISHAHGNYAGKTVAAGWGRAGTTGMGVKPSGRPTRNARTKAVFAALEAEIAGKLSELEALQREHVTLAQRVEILQVAVERQDAVLNLLRAAGSRPPAPASGMPSTASSACQQGQVRLPYGASAAKDAAAGHGSVESGGGNGGGSGGDRPVVGLSPAEVLSAGPGSPEGAELLEWARKCSLDMYKNWYKEHVQSLSVALLALEESPCNPEAEVKLVQLVAACWVRTCLVSVLQPLTILRLKGFNLEADTHTEPTDLHWLEVIRFMTVSPEQVAEMENLFHSYNLLHESFRAELQDTQRELSELLAAQDGLRAGGNRMCSQQQLELVLQQVAPLKRVRGILLKTHLLYSCTIGVAAMRILKPKEFAKCCVHSYPYYPCGPSLMRACAQFKAMHAIWGVPCCGGTQ